MIDAADIDSLIGNALNDTAIDNAANIGDRQAAMRRAAAIATLKNPDIFNFIKGLSPHDGIGFLDREGITLADMAGFDVAHSYNGNAAGPLEKHRKALRSAQTFSSTLATISTTQANPGRRSLFANVNNGVPILDWTQVRQGGIGDCYFISSIVALVEAGRGNEIVNMITSLEGGTRFRVAFPGQNAVFVDRPTYAEIAFYSNSGSDGMYLTVLSKAFGVLNQSYFYTTISSFDASGSGGLLQTGIRTMTGNQTGVTGRPLDVTHCFVLTCGNSHSIIGVVIGCRHSSHKVLYFNELYRNGNWRMDSTLTMLVNVAKMAE